MNILIRTAPTAANPYISFVCQYADKASTLHEIKVTPKMLDTMGLGEVQEWAWGEDEGSEFVPALHQELTTDELIEIAHYFFADSFCYGTIEYKRVKSLTGRKRVNVDKIVVQTKTILRLWKASGGKRFAKLSGMYAVLINNLIAQENAIYKRNQIA